MDHHPNYLGINQGEFQDPIDGGTVRSYHIFDHIFWGYSLKIRPQNRPKYMVGTSNLGMLCGYQWVNPLYPLVI